MHKCDRRQTDRATEKCVGIGRIARVVRAISCNDSALLSLRTISAMCLCLQSCFGVTSYAALQITLVMSHWNMPQVRLLYSTPKWGMSGASIPISGGRSLRPVKNRKKSFVKSVDQNSLLFFTRQSTRRRKREGQSIGKGSREKRKGKGANGGKCRERKEP